MEVNHRMYGIKVPTIEEEDRARNLLEKAKKDAADLLSEEPEYAGNQEKIDKQINKYQSMFYEPQKSGGGCLIATAACSSASSYEVIFLKDFRDTVLLSSTWGKCFVQFYYRVSPTIARAIESSAHFKRLTLFLFIKPLVRVLEFFRKM